MAYRRKQQVPKVSTFTSDFESPAPPPLPDESSSSSSASSLAAKAIRASSAYKDSSLSSAYGQSALSSPRGDSNPLRSSAPVSTPPSSAYKDSSPLSSAYSQSARSSPRDSNPLRSSVPVSTAKDSSNYEYTSMKNLGESKQGIWGVLARKAKSIIDDNNTDQPHVSEVRTRMQHMPDSATIGEQYDRKQLPGSRKKVEGHKFQKGLDALTSSLNYIGGTIGNAFEEGLAVVENRTADIIQETRKLQIRKKDGSSVPQNNASNISGTRQQPLTRTHMHPQTQTDLETQLKASRDVAMAMAAKAKLLLRELKTVKADLAFAKERCAQLEEENRILRVSREKGDNPEDDDLIRLQLETLLAEKARLAQENSVLTRENRFLREIVEYHQLTMQDVVYLDENSEEVTEVYPIKVVSPQVTKDISSHPVSSSEPMEVSCDVTSLSSFIQIPAEDDSGRH
ncbi:cell wall protein RBR3-like [Nicotiana sylvestris]|uniref:Uncharacterized protein n=2 Tax=Nicotiana TaxID=4085 RepID=A0A1S4D2K7_TOBAC|nr:PREDICTED: uncharacterized protein LOC104211536 [Nicotiana sylvestris]XP_016507504.1 PREDICTED: uncharacterized protein LOC107825189 [Nicotiana tabacum]